MRGCAGAQELRGVQNDAISIIAAAAALQTDLFLKNVAFQSLVSRKNTSAHIYFQDVAGPVALIMRMVWPHHQVDSFSDNKRTFTQMSNNCLTHWDHEVLRQVSQLEDLFCMRDVLPQTDEDDKATHETCSNVTDVADSLSDLFEENDDATDIRNSNSAIVSEAQSALFGLL